MKRIAIFCDGTWNRDDTPYPTNVVRMAQAVRLTAQDGHKQHVIYQRGVGSGRGSNWAARKLDRTLGGVFGWGLEENIEEAYRALVYCYEPGDEVFIFGFSRGAYTARSLAGLIRSCGIPSRDKVERIHVAIARYRSRKPTTHPDNPESFRFRHWFSPVVTTSKAELSWRQNESPGPYLKFNLEYLGVWDTVGALGVPGFLTVAPLINKSYQFHDTALSSSVASARHAIAIDERRRTFPPALWDNLERLNRIGLGLPAGTVLEPESRDTWVYRQEWFPGDHSSVGGGGENDGLSSATFAWIAEGAQTARLDLRPEKVAEVTAKTDVHALLIATAGAGWTKKLLKLWARDRAGPKLVCDVADFTKDRVKRDPEYRPAPLKRVMAAIQRAT